MRRVAVILVLATGAMAAKPKDGVPPPIVQTQKADQFGIARTVRTFGDWELVVNEEFIAALTENDTGSLFGILCSDKCSFYVNPGHSCRSGTRYPGLLNGERSAAINLVCAIVKESGEDQSVLLIDEDVSEIVGHAPQVGIAFPMASGGFAVSRFSMKGATAAISAEAVLFKTLHPQGRGFDSVM